QTSDLFLRREIYLILSPQSLDFLSKSNLTQIRKPNLPKTKTSSCNNGEIQEFRIRRKTYASRSIKKNAFALVKTDLFNSKSTTTDFDSGSYPRWNEKLVVHLLARTQLVTVELQCKVGAGNRVVGFLGDLTPESYIQFLSYMLRDPRGVKNGIVNFSVRVIGGGGGGIGYYGCSVAARKKEAAGFGGGYAASSCSTPSWKTTSSSWGVRAARDGDVGCDGGGVVIGVPVWGLHRN
ncbi:BON1-associated protein 1, partial [Linum grandiflorum]